MTTTYKQMAGGIALAFVLGVLAGRLDSKATPASQTKTVTAAEASSHSQMTEAVKDVVHKDIVTTTTKKSDGSQTTIVVDHSVVTDRLKETAEATAVSKSSTETTTTVFQAPQKTWSLGLEYAPGYAIRGQGYSPAAFTPEVGWRVLGGLWLEASFHTDSRSPTIGFRYEF